jgi:hypothetical protein
VNLAQLVIDAARRTPDAIAVQGPDGRCSYAELDARADRMAATLAGHGVGPGDRVALWPCGGRLRPLGAVLTPEDIATHLHGARAPPRPTPAGQLSLLP